MTRPGRRSLPFLSNSRRNNGKREHTDHQTQGIHKAYTFAETVGIIEAVLAYMQSETNQATLTGRNFAVAPHLTRLQGKLAAINALNTEQEQLKGALANKTTALTDATKDAYTDASGLIDAMMGMLGEGSAEARNLQAIRSRARRNSGGASAPAAAPQS